MATLGNTEHEAPRINARDPSARIQASVCRQSVLQVALMVVLPRVLLCCTTRNASRRSMRLSRIQGRFAETFYQHFREHADLARRMLPGRSDHIYSELGERIARHHLD